jgi:O-antigen/teichoic acid export membrane protein
MAIAGAHTVIENIAWLGAIGLALGSGADLDAAFTAAAAVMAGSAALAFALVVVLARVRPENPSESDVRYLLRQAGPFASFSALAVVAARMDTFLLGLLLPQGLAAAGVYYAMTRLVAVAEYLPDAVSRALYPRLSREFATDRARAGSTLVSATREVLALGIAIPFGFALVGPWLIELVYGPAFISYSWLLVAFGAAMPFRYLGFIFGVALTSAGRQSRRVQDLAIAVAISLVLNVVLIPSIGITGALISVVAGWVATCVLIVPDVNHLFGRVILLGDVVRSLGLAVVATVAAMTARAVAGGTLGDPIAAITFACVGLVGMFGRVRLESLVARARR